MALTDQNMYMPVAPAYGGSGFGGMGGDGWWIVLLLLCGFGGMGGMGGYGGYDFPWLLNGQNQINSNTNAGFDHAATQAALGDLSGAVAAGFGNMSTQLCGGFAGVNAAITGAQSALSQQFYTGQIADLERSYNEQTALLGALNNIQQQQATCCCENRAAVADLKYTVASEAANSRAAIQAGIQMVMDKLCTQELEAERRENANLRSQLNMAQLAASQNAQTAAIEASQAAQTQYIVNRVAPYPTPAYVVANPSTGCCGMAA